MIHEGKGRMVSRPKGSRNMRKSRKKRPAVKRRCDEAQVCQREGSIGGGRAGDIGRAAEKRTTWEVVERKERVRRPAEGSQRKGKDT